MVSRPANAGGPGARFDNSQGLCPAVYMKEIPLTQGKVALVDDADFEWLNQCKWCALQTSPGKWYAVRNKSRKAISGSRTIWMHRVVAAQSGNPEVDHKNGDGLDNRRGNLRPCTHSQNAANSKLNAKNTSGFRGVCWHPGAGKWMAYITAGGKRQHLGLWEDAETAARAYDVAAIREFGDFARPNFIQSGGAQNSTTETTPEQRHRSERPVASPLSSPEVACSVPEPVTVPRPVE